MTTSFSILFMKQSDKTKDTSHGNSVDLFTKLFIHSKLFKVDLALGSAETYFLEVGAYVSLKRAQRVLDRVTLAKFE